MKTFTPTIYNIPNPIGFDAEVYTIQTKLARIPWLQAIFAVAHVQRRYKSEEESTSMKNIGFRGSLRYEHLYPQGLKYGQSSKDPADEDLSFNDNYASRIFFLSCDDIDINPKVDGWNWVEQNILIAHKFSIILHCNQNSLQITSREQLKTDILYALGKCPKISGIRVFEDMENVWKEFTITPEINGCTRYPNYCLRVDMVCTYLAFPYNAALGYYPSSEVIPRSVIGWVLSQIYIEIVDNPNNSIQTLSNGDTIPIQYTANSDGTLTIPYLNSVYGISVLSRFMLNSRYYQGKFFINGNLNISQHGRFQTGDKLNFDSSIPVWSD